MTKTHFLLSSVPLLLLAFVLQRYLLSSDVAVLLDEAQRLLNGGQYVKDFFETNPPMAIYLYVPACLFAKLFTLNVFLSFRLYVLGLIFLSLACSVYLLKKILLPTQKAVFFVMVGMMALVLLLLPIDEFGQREHLMLVLIFPYLLAAVLYKKNISLPKSFTFLIGVMAGCGFAIKPYFLVTLVLIEVYLMLKKRHFFTWLRLEALLILMVLSGYYLSVLVWQPEYLSVMLPIIMHYYLGTHGYSWAEILSCPAVMLGWAGCLLYVVLWRPDQCRDLNTIFFLALLGMLAALFLQKTIWYYHLLPALSFAFLLLAHYVSQFSIAGWQKKSREALLIVSFIVLLYAWLMPAVIAQMEFKYQTHDTKNPTRFVKLRNFINAHGGEHSLYCLTPNGTHDCFPLTYLTESRYAGRPPFMWWVVGLSQAELKATTLPEIMRIARDKKFFLDSIADDLNGYHAHWLLVDYPQLNEFASQNEKLRLALTHYRFVTTINWFRIYERVG